MTRRWFLARVLAALGIAPALGHRGGDQVSVRFSPAVRGVGGYVQEAGAAFTARVRAYDATGRLLSEFTRGR